MTVVTKYSNLVEHKLERELEQLLHGSTQQVQRSLITVPRLHLKRLTTQLLPDLPDNMQFDGVVLCFGLSGVGKSRILDALDGNFRRRGSPRFKDVVLYSKHLHLMTFSPRAFLPTGL